ncbi:hypothetical protein MLD38_018628 [Melastoma candidum]|uniref:Uncharacterized protein n=1 Tax=Melastoma candidum TaxID=119954 RepID=A0ACB9QTL3_9MYRT|nr:hypothetical protein MLD38_018628 [Melastoma candidum]
MSFSSVVKEANENKIRLNLHIGTGKRFPGLVNHSFVVDLCCRYASTGKLTTKSDVYSHGVVLLELLTGRVPVDSKTPPGEHVLISWVGKTAVPFPCNYPKKELIQVAAIAAVCMQPEADYRPLMVDIVQSLIPLVRNYVSLSSSPSMRIQTVQLALDISRSGALNGQFPFGSSSFDTR